MMRSLFSGVSGLRNHQTRMDVIGDNIANVNTAGYKASRVTFQDVMSQTLQGASGPQGNQGGTNPMQVGLGMSMASIDTLFTSSSFQPTGKQTDLAIQGDGFFIVGDGQNKYYTRAGGFDFDSVGNFVVPGSGLTVMGWNADAAGNINSTAAPVPIFVNKSATMAATATNDIKLGGNIAADAKVGDTTSTLTTIYDSQGISHDVRLNYSKYATNQWLVNTSVADATGAITGQLKLLNFDNTGKLSSVQDATVGNTVKLGAYSLDNSAAGATSSFTAKIYDASGALHDVTFSFARDAVAGQSTVTVTENGTTLLPATGPAPDPLSGQTITLGGTVINFAGSAAPTYAAFSAPAITPQTITPSAASPIGFSATGGANPLSITLDFSQMAQNGSDDGKGTSSPSSLSQNGYGAGSLSSVTVDTSGKITGVFSNGVRRVMAQVGIATFTNPGGLLKQGSTMFAESNNSGQAQVNVAGTGSRGTISPGNLEMSNVDLASEFSNMIITQRGFEANSKIISVSDEMLQDLANLKR